MRIRTCFLRSAVAAFFAVGMLSISASATTVTLSDASSDEVAMPASTLNATLEFTVSGSTMTLDVTNTSTGTIHINELMFNGTSDVTSITLTSAGSQDGLWVGSSSFVSTGFGTFDFGLEGIKVGKGPSAQYGDILAGSSLQFTFSVSGSGFDASSFSTDLSSGGAIAAAFFLPNGGNNGQYGAAMPVPVPEPSTAALMTLGLIGLTKMGRRRN